MESLMQSRRRSQKSRASRNGFIRQQVIEQLMRQIMHYDDEFRREEATSRRHASKT
jgi:hypothetical protein